MLGIPCLLRHPKYHQFWTTQKGADQFAKFKKRLQRDGISVLEELPGLGPITKDHLAKNIGFLDVAKADIWLERAATLSGCGVQELIDDLHRRHGESRHTIDVAIWMLGRDGLLSSKVSFDPLISKTEH